jgi:hypothetical protein
MHCILLDTGNDAFLKRIADNFCTKTLQTFISLLTDGKFAEQDKPADMEKAAQYFKTYGDKLLPGICRQLSVSCNNSSCNAGHIIALASNQINMLGNSMANCISVLAGTLSVRQRLNLQKIFHMYSALNTRYIMEVPLDYMPEHDKYLKKYIKLTNKLTKNADCFVYVRAKDASDYNFFIKNTKLPNVTPCDNLQNC